MKFLIEINEKEHIVSAKDEKEAALKAVAENCDKKILEQSLKCKYLHEIKSILFDQYINFKIEAETPNNKYIIAYWSRCCAWLTTTSGDRKIAFELKRDFGRSTGISFDDPMTATVYVAPWPLKGKSY